MNLQFVRYFVALAETKNFTHAAEKVFVVQSTFSAGIKKLEDHLGCQLFYRDKRNVGLTNEGVKLLPKAKQLLSLWNSVESEFKHTESKTLKIGVLTDLINDAFVPILKSFKELHGHINVSITDDVRDLLVEKLVKNNLDAIFIEEEHIDETNFSKKLIYTEKLEIAVPENHFLANKDQVELKAISKLPFIERCNCKMFSEVEKTFANRKIEIDTVFSARTNETAASLVNSGLGITLLSKPEKRIDGIKFIPICDANFERQIILIWKRDNNSTALHNFISI